MATVVATIVLLNTAAYSQSVGIGDDGAAPPPGIDVEIDFNKTGNGSAVTWLLMDGDVITSSQTANITGLDIDLATSSGGTFNTGGCHGTQC